MKLPLGFLDHVENSARNFPWKGKEIVKKGKCLVKWEKVCLPKLAGGLGVKKSEDSEYIITNENFVQIHEPEIYPMGTIDLARTL